MRVYRVEVRVRGEQGWVKSDVLFYILGDASEYAWRLYRQPQVETWQVVDLVEAHSPPVQELEPELEARSIGAQGRRRTVQRLQVGKERLHRRQRVAVMAEYRPGLGPLRHHHPLDAHRPPPVKSCWPKGGGQLGNDLFVDSFGPRPVAVPTVRIVRTTTRPPAAGLAFTPRERRRLPFARSLRCFQMPLRLPNAILQPLNLRFQVEAHGLGGLQGIAIPGNRVELRHKWDVSGDEAQTGPLRTLVLNSISPTARAQVGLRAGAKRIPSVFP